MHEIVLFVPYFIPTIWCGPMRYDVVRCGN